MLLYPRTGLYQGGEAEKLNYFSAAGSVSAKSVYPGISGQGAATREQNFRLIIIIIDLAG